MEIRVRDDRHLVEVWLSNAEKKDTSLREGLKRLYAEYKKKKYLVAVFESGEGDPSQTTMTRWEQFCFAMEDLAKRQGW